MEKKKRGRKVNPVCATCGVVKTDENTHRRSGPDSYFCHECKACTADRVYKARLSKESDEWLYDRLKQCARESRFIKEELNLRHGK